MMLPNNRELLINNYDESKVQMLRVGGEGFPIPDTGFTAVEFTTCLGAQNIKFFSDPSESSSKLTPASSHIDKRGRQMFKFKNPMPAKFYAEVRADTSKDDTYLKNGAKSTYLAKAYTTQVEPFELYNQIRPESDVITYSTEDKRYRIHLEWEPLRKNYFSQRDKGEVIGDVEYTVLISDDKDVNLMSLCALNSQFSKKNTLVPQRTTQLSKIVSIDTDHFQRINVIARVNSGAYKDYLYSYKSFDIEVISEGLEPGEEAKSHLTFVLFFLISCTVFSCIVVEYKRKTNGASLTCIEHAFLWLPLKIASLIQRKVQSNSQRVVTE